ncbi:monocarboxylate transporter 12-like [Mytilus trossulus]|uniref:monocarboxylate transporter 12-like n=1 Tax=Mytilus trossulus TaxID=6551 RepID=UPI0030072E64
MAKSCEKKDEAHDLKEEAQAPDGGWGWIVLVGAVLLNLLIGGAVTTFGVLYVELLDLFHQNASKTAWVGSVANAMGLLFSPVASAMSTRFSCRSMALVGGVITSIGWMTTGFMPRIEYMFITYGLVAGIGKSMANIPSIIMVGRWFDKRRSLANGLATAGAGVGTFIFAPLLEFLLRRYGFQGTMLIMSSVMLNICVCGSLFRPVPQNTKLKGSSLTGIENRVFTIDESTDCSMAAKGSISHKAVDGISNKVTINNSDNDKKYRQSNSDKNKTLKSYFDYTLLTNRRFICFCISVMLATLGHSPASFMLPALAMQYNIRSKEAAFLLSITGIADIVGRITFGVLCDVKIFKKNRQTLYVFAIFISGVANMCCGFATEYWHFVIYSCIFGLFAGSYNVLTPVMLVDLLGVGKLASSCGLALLFQGLGFLVGPPIAGFVTDMVGDYQSGFYFAGVAMVISAIVVNLSTFCTLFTTQKKDNYEIDRHEKGVNDLHCVEHIKTETKRSSGITMMKLNVRSI